MNYIFQKNKRSYPSNKNGFSIIEILIVMAISVIALSIVLALKSGGSAGREVDSAANQIAAQLRSLQNEASNGKKIGDVVICGFKFDSTALSSYTVSYHDCASPTANTIETLSPVKLKNVNMDSVVVVFQSPRAETDNSYAVTVASTKDSDIKKSAVINSSGSIEVVDSAVVVPAGTCSDGIKNGTETNVDCGGSCSACVAALPIDGVCAGNGKSCVAGTGSFNCDPNSCDDLGGTGICSGLNGGIPAACSTYTSMCACP